MVDKMEIFYYYGYLFVLMLLSYIVARNKTVALLMYGDLARPLITFLERYSAMGKRIDWDDMVDFAVVVEYNDKKYERIRINT